MVISVYWRGFMKLKEFSRFSTSIDFRSMSEEKIVHSAVAGQTHPSRLQNRELSWKIASSLWVSFRYAWAGLTYAFQTQRNFRIHGVIGTLALGLGIFLQLPWVEVAVIGLTSGLVMAMELLNTAIEAVVDLAVEKSYHELARIAKDCAAGAVLVSALVSVIVACCLLLPPLWSLVAPIIW